MKDFFKKYKNISTLIPIFLFSSLGIFAFRINAAKADFDIISWFAGKALDLSFEGLAWIFAKLGVIVQTVVSLFFWFVSMLFEIALGLTGFTDAGIVQLGWQITRDITNMFFVLILLIIAFATILRVETYGMKQILWKLVAAAILINFSLVIAAAVIDFSQVLTDFFYQEIKEGVGISAQIAGVIKIQKTWELNDDANLGEKLAAGISGVFMVIFASFLGIILTLVVTIAIGLGAFFLIVRLLYLWFLLILAPIAWLLWVLPATKHLFQQWWDSFLKWSFFAPIYTFFVYLAIKAGEGGAFSSIIQQETENIIDAEGFSATVGAALAAQPRLLLQFIAIVGILFGGLIVAQKMGVYGASGTIGLAKRAGKGTANWAGKKIQVKTSPQAQKIGSAVQRRFAGGTKEQRILARPFRALGEKERAALGESEKKYKGWTSTNLKSQFESVDARDKAAIAKILAERGDFSEDKGVGFRDSHITDALKVAKRYEQHGAVLKSRPDLAPLVKDQKDSNQQAIEKVVSKMKPADTEKLQDKSLNNDVITAITEQLKQTGKWNRNHLSKMADTNPALMQKIRDEVITPNKGKGVFGQDIENYLNTSPGNAIFGGQKKPTNERRSDSQATEGEIHMPTEEQPE